MTQQEKEFRVKLVELLKAQQWNALEAAVQLQRFCQDMLCHFNTADMRDYDPPLRAAQIVSSRKEWQRVLAFASGSGSWSDQGFQVGNAQGEHTLQG